MLKELMKYIGAECTIYFIGSDVPFRCTIKKLEEQWMLVETELGIKHLVNVQAIQSIAKGKA